MRVANDGLRTFLGVYGSRRKAERRTKIPLVLTPRGSEEVETQVTPEEHPFCAAFSVFDPPELLSGRPAARTVSTKIVMVNGKSDLDAKLKPGDAVRVPGSHRASDVIRMLAKIGHSYATAEYGPSSFTPFLINLILNDDFEANQDVWPRWIGIRQTPRYVFSPNLHELNLEPHNVEGKFYIVCTIRLFAYIPEAPTYDVVVGAHWHSSFSPRTHVILRSNGSARG